MQIGYDPFFLGERHPVPLPVLAGEAAKAALHGGKVYDFVHFSIVMNRVRRCAIYSAACVDASRLRPVPRDNKSWHFDERIGEENQIGDEFYRQNDYDKGHLTRRKDICWGTYEEAARANYDSFCYANIALQHHSFNTGIWNCLEDWILSRMKEPNRLLVYTGPILKEEDEEYCGVQGEPGCQVKVPFGFWKTVFFLQENTEITCLSFLIRQTPDRLQGDCGYQRLATYQVPLSTITEQAEVNFRPELYERNPLLVRAVDADRRGETKRPIRQEAVVINNLEDIRLA